MLQILKVTGESLSPLIQAGDYVLMLKLRGSLRRLKAGDIIVFRHPAYGVLIKRVDSQQAGGEVVVSGVAEDSLDSRQLGPVPLHWVVGKVIWHIRPS